jgi:hypothetical protein
MKDEVSPAAVVLAGARSGRGCPRGPGETARLGQLAGDGLGDLLAERVGAADREHPIDPALNFYPQAPHAGLLAFPVILIAACPC